MDKCNIKIWRLKRKTIENEFQDLKNRYTDGKLDKGALFYQSIIQEKKLEIIYFLTYKLFHKIVMNKNMLFRFGFLKISEENLKILFLTIFILFYGKGLGFLLFTIAKKQ